MTTNPHPDDEITRNALHAAETWLQRIGANHGAVAVVNFLPRSAVGVWTPGAANVGMLPTIDDASAELCDAAAPWLQSAMERLRDQGQHPECAAALQAGAALRAFLVPSAREVGLVIEHDGTRVVLISTQLIDQLH